MAVATRPGFDLGIECFPAPQIEVTHAEISPFADLQSLAEGGQQRRLDVIEDSGHCLSLPLRRGLVTRSNKCRGELPWPEHIVPCKTSRGNRPAGWLQTRSVGWRQKSVGPSGVVDSRGLDSTRSVPCAPSCSIAIQVHRIFWSHRCLWILPKSGSNFVDCLYRLRENNNGPTKSEKPVKSEWTPRSSPGPPKWCETGSGRQYIQAQSPQGKVAPQLRTHGVSVTFGRTYKGWFITRASDAVPNIQSPGANPSPVSSSADENSAGNRSTSASPMMATC